MTPQEARRRAEEVLRQQSAGTQIVRLNSDGTLDPGTTPKPLGRKPTILHDPHGEYA